MKSLLAAVLLVLPLAACVGPMTPISDPENDEAALVYGYINGRSGVPNVTLYNTKTRVMAPWVKGNEPAHTFGSGLVVFDNVAPGDYIIHGFGIGQTSYSLGTQRIELTVQPGEIIYLGAFRYAHEGGMFSSEFSFKPTREPSRQKVLDWAIEATDGTGWSRRLQKSG
jgi:hypothetical protein